MTSLQIGKYQIQRDGASVYFIAEIGQNHQGSLDMAKNMIVQAKKSGCNCVKFQKSCLQEKFTETALQRKYDGINSWGETYGDHKKYLEFSIEQYRELQQFCKELEIDFTASAMDHVSLQQLDALDVPFLKIGSGDSNNFPMLEKAAMLQRPLVISTGMTTTKMIERIVQIMEAAKKTNYAIMHCVSSYPTEPSNCELHRITWLKQRFPNLVIGYSGHELGLEISQTAVLLGARIIERHFTLDKNQKGSDHKCSLEPMEMSELVSTVQSLMKRFETKQLEKEEILSLFDEKQDVREALKECSDEKCIMSCEMPCREKLGKSLVAAKSLKLGHKIALDDICVKVSEPNGIWAEYIDDVVGSEISNCVELDMPLTWNDIV